MNRVFAAIAVTAVALGSTAAFAETVVGPAQAKVKAEWAQIDKTGGHANPFASLIDLITAPAEAVSDATKGDTAVK
ncbi:MAG: hypothetical protein AAF415_17360 [Pseudomonadota bacterium]